MAGPIVLLDLDGTLTNPLVGITRSILHAISTLGLAAPEGDLDWCIGPPLRESMVRLVGEARADETIQIYRARYASVGLLENEVYRGIPALLTDLGAQGRDVRLATSKPIVYARRIMAHFELDSVFSALHGSELDGTRTNKSDLLAYILGDRTDAIMVGDRKHDVEAARAQGLRSVGVLWGFGGRAELEAAGADWVVDSPADLQALLRELS